MAKIAWLRVKVVRVERLRPPLMADRVHAPRDVVDEENVARPAPDDTHGPALLGPGDSEGDGRGDQGAITLTCPIRA